MGWRGRGLANREVAEPAKNAQGEYVENRSFRVHDLPVVAHALMRAFAFAMDEREMNGSCPF